MPILNTMNKRAFFIVGPESSGTRFINRSFISAGCYSKYKWQFSEHDGRHNFNVKADIVFHRSLPHQRLWPDLAHLRLSMENSGFNVVPLLVVRDWRCTVLSQLHREMVESSAEAEKNIRKAVHTVATHLMDFTLISYENFCEQPQFREWLFVERFGLKPSTEPIYDGNAKYYEDKINNINGG